MSDITKTTKAPFQQIRCPVCNQLLSEDRSNRPFKSETRDKLHDGVYEKITRCPRCHEWVGAYIPEE